jgi:very-short-patch-repair endonuclease
MVQTGKFARLRPINSIGNVSFRPKLENLYSVLQFSYSLWEHIFMNEYLSHFSAAAIWNIPYIEAALGSEITKAASNDRTVFEHEARFRVNGRRVHSCELALPAGAVVARNGTMVASPELLFLELARKLSIHRLILLGLQLCSHSPGQPSEAITTKRKLKAFLAKTSGHRGHRKAERALKYIQNGSASIMESMAYMILTLPHALGGYGLDDAVFNHEIKLKDERSKRLGQKRCFVDLYYKQAKLAIEYDSFAYHNSPLEQGKDLMRSAMLERQGLDLIRISTIQLYNKDACEEFAFNLAARLGKRIHIRASGFDEMHMLLRAILPDGKPVSEPDSMA